MTVKYLFDGVDLKFSSEFISHNKMELTTWKEFAKMTPFVVSQVNFWKFGMDHGTYNITLENWRVKVYLGFMFC